MGSLVRQLDDGTFLVEAPKHLGEGLSETRELKEEIGAALLKDHVVIDLANTKSMDAHWVRWLADVTERALQHHHILLLEGASTEVERVIDYIGQRPFLNLAAAEKTPETNTQVALLQAENARLQKQLGDSVFNCVRCGGHDFGLFASKIEKACGPCRDRADKAEADLQEAVDAIASMQDEDAALVRFVLTYIADRFTGPEPSEEAGEEVWNLYKSAKAIADNIRDRNANEILNEFARSTNAD